ncbi:MAG: hypothetical protein ACLFWF_10550 [Alphaproteobacteria bacterium]
MDGELLHNILMLINIAVIPAVVWIFRGYFGLKEDLRKMGEEVSEVRGRQSEMPSAAQFGQLHVAVERLSGNIAALGARLDGEVNTMNAHLKGFENLMKKLENLTDLQQRYLMQQDKKGGTGK